MLTQQQTSCHIPSHMSQTPTGLVLQQRYEAIRTMDSGIAHRPNTNGHLLACLDGRNHICILVYRDIFIKPNLFFKTKETRNYQYTYRQVCLTCYQMHVNILFIFIHENCKKKMFPHICQCINRAHFGGASILDIDLYSTR